MTRPWPHGHIGDWWQRRARAPLSSLGPSAAGPPPPRPSRCPCTRADWQRPVTVVLCRGLPTVVGAGFATHGRWRVAEPGCPWEQPSTVTAGDVERIPWLPHGPSTPRGQLWGQALYLLVSPVWWLALSGLPPLPCVISSLPDRGFLHLSNKSLTLKLWSWVWLPENPT